MTTKEGGISRPPFVLLRLPRRGEGFCVPVKKVFHPREARAASGGPLFPAAFSFYASGGILFVNSDKKYAEAPPVADAARRFRGSAPIGRHDSAGESAGTTVLPRRLSRIFRDRERVRRFCRSSSCIFCRSRRGRGHCGRSSGPGGAAFSRCRRRRCFRRWPWPPAHA